MQWFNKFLIGIVAATVMAFSYQLPSFALKVDQSLIASHASSPDPDPTLVIVATGHLLCQAPASRSLGDLVASTQGFTTVQENLSMKANDPFKILYFEGDIQRRVDPNVASTSYLAPLKLAYSSNTRLPNTSRLAGYPANKGGTAFAKIRNRVPGETSVPLNFLQGFVTTVDYGKSPITDRLLNTSFPFSCPLQ